MPNEIPTNDADVIVSSDVTRIHGINELWEETLGDPGVCVAILDGPVELSHPSLVGAKLTQIETLASSGLDSDSALRHGTQITSIIFGQHNGPVFITRMYLKRLSHFITTRSGWDRPLTPRTGQCRRLVHRRLSSRSDQFRRSSD